ncbi:polygalacturonase-like [Actinidia eriantha]|uniref:polygalacturonase-like n=1 Tax=Actinidia eriantha TaxID=165200 RepID=UPI0025858AD3|nr:polygalacturonase-like [Actinidia eriantha]
MYKTKMLLYGHVVPLFIILLASITCFSITFEDQILINNNDFPRLYKVCVPSSSPRIVNVDHFGAKGDGTDDSQAFTKAWKEACASTGAVLVVPKNRIYHLKPITFSGPCSSNLTIKIDGTIKASNHPSDYNKDPRHWIVFENIQNFKVQGGGTINGNGRVWWRNSCKINKSLPCKEAPTAITFLRCENLGVSGLRIKNSQQIHLSFQKCVHVRAWNLLVVAPRNSPNTDGIHVTGTKNIQIMNSVIRTGDDCISIVSGSKNVKVMDITCGPGHGISIGSLGKGKSEAFVSDVSVNRAKLSGTTNGVRIKTWQGGSGYAKNIIFQNIVMHNVSNPIIIDQNYCDQDKPCPKQDSAVKIQNVWYKNIKGTSASEIAIKLDCSKSFPCKGIVLQDINLARDSSDGHPKASCINVDGLSSRGKVSPPCS